MIFQYGKEPVLIHRIFIGFESILEKGSYYLESKINSAFVTSGGNSTPVETSRSWTGEDSTPDPIPDVYLYIYI